MKGLCYSTKAKKTSKSTEKELKYFFDTNNFPTLQRELIRTVIAESKLNNFTVKIQFSK
jgi:hypothetical protein